jgi:D-arabinose 5-phosphate isomerase GutQ
LLDRHQGAFIVPLFKIAKTYNTQLICFTHRNTSVITNQFELIYSLRVIREAGSSREYLEAKSAKDDKQAVEMIESSLFEIGDWDQIGFI